MNRGQENFTTEKTFKDGDDCRNHFISTNDGKCDTC